MTLCAECAPELSFSSNSQNTRATLCVVFTLLGAGSVVSDTCPSPSALSQIETKLTGTETETTPSPQRATLNSKIYDQLKRSPAINSPKPRPSKAALSRDASLTTRFMFSHDGHYFNSLALRQRRHRGPRAAFTIYNRCIGAM